MKVRKKRIENGRGEHARVLPCETFFFFNLGKKVIQKLISWEISVFLFLGL